MDDPTHRLLDESFVPKNPQELLGVQVTAERPEASPAPPGKNDRIEVLGHDVNRYTLSAYRAEERVFIQACYHLHNPSEEGGTSCW